jgi:hypothetical protein
VIVTSPSGLVVAIKITETLVIGGAILGCLIYIGIFARRGTIWAVQRAFNGRLNPDRLVMCSKVIGWFAVGVAEIVACMATVFVISPLLFYFSIARILDAVSPPPKIAQDFFGPGPRRDDQTISKLFSSRLQEKFPVGGNETALVNELGKEGFRPLRPPPRDCLPPGQQPPLRTVFTRCYDPKYKMEYIWGRFVCSDRLYVEWAADENGKIIKVTGTYHQACL